MSETITRLVPIFTLAVLIAFLGHSYITFRKKKVYRFFQSWQLLWTSFIILYACVVFSLPQAIALFAVHLVALSFFLCADALRANQVGGDFSPADFSRAAIEWCILMLLSLAVSLQLQPEWRFAPANVFSFLGLSLYAARHASVFPKAKDTVVLLLFSYAGLQMFTPGSLSKPLVLTAFLLLLPLKIVLYYSGYVTLYYLAEKRGAQDLPVIPARRDSGKEPLPTPIVRVELKGILGFAYIIARYPSGWVLLVFLLASFVSGTLSIIEHPQYLAEIGKHLSVVLEKQK